jgi:hypothetical protein
MAVCFFGACAVDISKDAPTGLAVFACAPHGSRAMACEQIFMKYYRNLSNISVGVEVGQK